jgi:hypothetical protein
MERKPGPGLMGVDPTGGVAVSFPIKIGIGTKVEVGKFGSCVGMRTIVAEGVTEGVIVGVRVIVGVNVTVAVEVGAGVFVAGNNTSAIGMPAQACNKNVHTIIK